MSTVFTVGIVLFFVFVLGEWTQGRHVEAAYSATPGTLVDRVDNSAFDVERLKRSLPPGLFPNVVDILQAHGGNDVYGVIAGPTATTSFRVGNPPHAINAWFEASGPRIGNADSPGTDWAIGLSRFGRGGTFHAAANSSLQGSGNRVEYRFPGGVDEWYVNGPLGLQQGFTIQTRPADNDSGPLILYLGLAGGMRAEIDPDGQSATLRRPIDNTTYRYAGLYAFDSTGTRLPASLKATPSGFSIHVADARAAYPITIDPFIQRGQFDSLPERWQPRSFARALAVDGETAAVTMPSYSAYHPAAAVYVFTKGTDGWGESEDAVKLSSPSLIRDDGFGVSVAVSGDLIVVGASQAGDNYSRAGAAFVYQKPAEGWRSGVAPVTLTPPADDSGGYFGNSVATDGDSIVVGAPYNAQNKIGAGAAFVFAKGPDGWTEDFTPVKLAPPGGANRDRFGSTVSIDGATIAVGAPGSDAVAPESGAVYVFTRTSAGWDQDANPVRLKAASPAPGDYFGSAVALDGGTLVVGAPQRSEEYSPEHPRGKGFVVVYSRAAGQAFGPSGSTILGAGDGEQGEGFGSSVAVDGRFIVVGSPRANGVTEDTFNGYRFPVSSGVAYVYERPAAGWNSSAAFTKLAPKEISWRDRFGEAVAIADGSVVVGSPYDDNLNGEDAGSAYFFDTAALGRTGDPALARVLAFDEPGGDQFGTSAAMTAEVLVVGAPGDSDEHPESGAAFVFSKRERQWQGDTEKSRIKLTAPTPAAGERFGQAVAIDDQTIVIGAPADGIADGAGSAYVFTRPESGWSAEATAIKLTAPTPAAGERFGQAVAIDDQTIVIGAPADGIADGAGSAYVFTRPESGWSAEATAIKLTAPTPAAGERFGQAVAIDDQTIVIGAPADGIADGAGSAYVFTRPESGWSAEATAIKLTAPTPAAGERFGQAVAIDDQTIVIGAPADGIADGAGSAYVFGLATLADPTALTAADAEAGDRFGSAVAIDGEVIAVGAPGDDGQVTHFEIGTQVTTQLPDSGSVYAFRRHGYGWTGTTDADKLPATDANAGDAFGHSVTLVGESMAAGMPGDWLSYSASRPGPRAGSVRVFTWPGLFWVDTPNAFKFSPPDPSDSSVSSITISADGKTAVQATWRATESDDYAAGAYIYAQTDGRWDVSDPIRIEFPERETYSVGQLAVSENGETIAVVAARREMPQEPAGIVIEEVRSADGTVTIAVIEPDEPADAGPEPDPGAVFVYTRPPGGWGAPVTPVRLGLTSEQIRQPYSLRIAASDDTIVVGEPDNENETGAYAGAAYVFTRPANGWDASTEPVKLTAPNGQPWARFGSAIAVSGDEMAIGAPQDDNFNGRDAGSVYVYSRGSRGWGLHPPPAKLVAPAGLRGERFGESVAIGHGRIAVGAPQGGRTWRAEGTVYVFHRPNGGWGQPYISNKLASPEPRSGGRFGASLAITRDHLIVGGKNGSWSPGTGKVFVYPVPAGRSYYTGSPAVLADPHGGSYDLFGAAVTAGGDSIAVLAPRADGEGFRGEAYLFTMPEAGWEFSRPGGGYVARINGFGPTAAYGSTPSVVGDGVEIAYVAQPLGFPHRSSVVVFTGSPGAWVTVDDFAILSAPSGRPVNDFGRTLAKSGNLLVVGAPPKFGDTVRSGSVYVFARPPAGWQSGPRPAELTAPPGIVAVGFGNSLAVSGDTVAVGAPAGASGAAFVYQKPASGGWKSTASAVALQPPRNAGDGYFGTSVAIDGDIIVVGMPGGESAPGAVYVFERPGRRWRSTSSAVKLSAPDGTAGDGFGLTVAISGGTIVVGSLNGNAIDSGAAYVFTRHAGGWVSGSQAAKLEPSEATSRFGHSVAIRGQTVVIGAIGHSRHPLAFVFEMPPSGWVSTTKATRLAPLEGVENRPAQRWAPVHIAQESILVGAESEFGLATVYVFKR